MKHSKKYIKVSKVLHKLVKKVTGNLKGYVIGLLILIIICLLIASNRAVPAQTADRILRPLLGSKNTIGLESVYFTFNDQVNKLAYSYKKPNSDIFSSPLINDTISNNSASSDAMDLASISPQNSVSPLPLEGVWQKIPMELFPNTTVMAKTFIRPDPSRSYAIVSLVKMDMKKLGIGIQAGTYYPGGTHGVFGPGIVPKDLQLSNTLVAVFNGGFMEKDGHYGMVVKNKVYVPLRKGLATLLIYSDGTARLIDYQGQVLGSDVIGIRQNGAFLVHNGSVTPFVEYSQDTWGRTTTNSMYTWRSGIGITKNGNIIYAVGNSLVPQTLAEALQKAGAVDAMQLDVNPYWVRFILYSPFGNGKYSYYPLLKDMQNGGYAYLHGYNKDFFYIFKKV